MSTTRLQEVLVCFGKQMFGKQSTGCAVAAEDENRIHDEASFRILDSFSRIHPSQSAIAQ